MRADLVVACDGRASTLRTAAGLTPRNFGAPMDVWWFRLPRHDGDPRGLNGVFQSGHGCALIDRGDYFQVAYLIRKGADTAMRAEGIESLRRQVTELVPWLADRVETLTSFDDVKLLDVQLNRLRRWYTDGLLFIGDAAHAMSPIGGVGINLAVADAVAAARILAGPLRRHSVTTRDLARIQARRWLPAAIIQRVQRLVQDRAIAVALGADHAVGTAPRAVRIAARIPALQAIAGLRRRHRPAARARARLREALTPAMPGSPTSGRRVPAQSMMCDMVLQHTEPADETDIGRTRARSAVHGDRPRAVRARRGHCGTRFRRSRITRSCRTARTAAWSHRQARSSGCACHGRTRPACSARSWTAARATSGSARTA